LLRLSCNTKLKEIMASEPRQCADDVRPFQCFFCPNGCVCLRWHRTLLLHFSRDDVSRALECLEDLLKQPTGAFVLGGGPFCACRAADGFCYLVCQDRVVLRLSAENARDLYSELASVRARV
jgi:hypothetical protein